MRAPNSCGNIYPTVSGRLIVVAPASITAETTSTRNLGSVRHASSAENSTSPWSRSRRSSKFYGIVALLDALLPGYVQFMFKMDVASCQKCMYTMQRCLFDSHITAFNIFLFARAKPAILIGLRCGLRSGSIFPTSFEIASTASKSPGEEIGKPASQTSP